MAEAPPNAVVWLLKATRWVLDGLGDYLEDHELTAALLADFGIDLPADDTAAEARRKAFKDKLADLTAKIDDRSGAVEQGEAIDEQVFELLLAASAFQQPFGELFFSDAEPDAELLADFVYAFMGLVAGERMRRDLPLLYALNRLVMVGYERIEDVPRFNPFAIYDRLTGKGQLSTVDAGNREWVGGLAPFALLGIQAFVKWLKGRHNFYPKPKDGEITFTGEADFKLGWEYDPNEDAELLALLERTLSLALNGELKREGSAPSIKLGVSATMMAMDGADGTPGALVYFDTDCAGALELPSGGGGKVKRSFEVTNLQFADAYVGFGIDLEDALGGPQKTAAWAFKVKGTEEFPALRIGNAGDTRFDMAGFSLGAEIEGDKAGGFAKIDGGLLVFEPGKISAPGLSAFFEAIGAGKIEAKFDVKASVGKGKGLAFSGGGGLRARLASDINLRVFEISYVDVELGHGEKGFKLGVVTAGKFKIGKYFHASLDRFGFDYAIEPGKRGAFKPVPPKGIGLKFDFSKMRGGGFLLLDFEKGEFAGALELNFFGFSLKAILILNTKVPGADFALLAMIFGRWPGGAELGFRFTLNAVGGMLGVNRRFDYQKLVDALPAGAMDDVMFPPDPVGDAPRIISSLNTICPVQPGAYTLVLMAEVGWGSDYICSLKLGVVLPLDSMDRIDLLASLSIVCFKDSPKAIRLQLIADAAGYIQFKPFGMGFDARLRDSRFGPTTIHGHVIFRLKTGDDSRFLLSAGGFHPSFRDVPADMPAKIDRLRASYDIGVIKISAQGYFALAAGTIQIGFELDCRYKLSSLAFRGTFSIDALIHLDPFEFETGASANVALEFKGHELFGIHIQARVWGPDRCRIKGRGEFSILFWDVGVDFDECWGDDVSTEKTRIALAPLVAEDLANPTNWTLELPAGAGGWVTLADVPQSGDVESAFAHPLSRLVYRQRRIPFDFDLDRVGSAAIDGLRRFPAPQISAGDLALKAEVVTDPFMVGEYVEMKDADRLSRPSFETLASGLRVGSDDFMCSPAEEAALDFELIYLPARERVRKHPFQLSANINAIVAREAAGQSRVRGKDRFADQRGGFAIKQPGWTAIDPATRAEVITATPERPRSLTAAEAAAASAGKAALLIETFELAA